MKPHQLFFRYFSKEFLKTFAITILVIISILLLASVFDILRRIKDVSISFGGFIELVTLKLPLLIQEVIHFIAFFSTLFFLIKLKRSQELIVAKNSGLSYIQIVLSPAIIAFVVGGIWITILNPLGAVMYQRFEKLEQKYFEKNNAFMSVTKNGIWLKDNTSGNKVIHATKIDYDKKIFEGLQIINFDPNYNFLSRYDAEEAILSEDGNWLMKDVVIFDKEGNLKEQVAISVPTIITWKSLQENFVDPKTIPIFELQAYIKNLESIGFSAQKHRFYLYSLLAKPLMLAAMAFVAACFVAGEFSRTASSINIVIYAIIGSFLIHILTEVFSNFAKSSGIPLSIATLLPPSTIYLLAKYYLLTTEEV